MGLLDFFESPTGQGLLGAAFGALGGRGTPLQAIGQGGLLGLNAYQGAKDRIAEQQQLQKRNQLWDAQIAETQAQAQQRQQAADLAQSRGNYWGSIGKTTDPRVGAQPNQVSPQDLVRLQYSPAEAQAFMGMKNWGRPTVKDYKEIRGADGSVKVVGLDEYGDTVGTGLTPYKAPEFRDLGGSVVGIDPVTLQQVWRSNKTMSPGEAASNALGWANNNVSRQRLALDISNQGKPEFKDGQWVTPPRDMKPGEIRSVVGGQKDANDALALIQQARDILPNATGSGLGAVVDSGARFFGGTTAGAQAGAKLKAIEGALVAKMPKMTGPQSDKDVLLYRQMAATVGDETKPVAERLAALDTVEEIQSRYAGGQGGTRPKSGAPRVISSDADYGALPSGTLFTAPDGSVRRKP